MPFWGIFLLTCAFLFSSEPYPSFLKEKSFPPPPPPYHEEILLELNHPTYTKGVVATDEGGVIYEPGLWIQAQHIRYFPSKEVGEHKIQAWGDLLFQYKDRVYIGEELEYHFSTKKGWVIQGKTYVNPFYLGGKTIHLLSDGSCHIEEGFLTTSENKNAIWHLQAKKVEVVPGQLLTASHLRLHGWLLPIWLPSFRLNLKAWQKDPLFRYMVTWDKGVGPRFSLRTQLFSWQNLILYFRGEYRLRKGFGGAIEAEYTSEDKRVYFAKKSYLASDIIPTDPIKKRRYRLQGEGHWKNGSATTQAHLTWDKYSDLLMPGDFKSTDFEINTAKKTEFILYHQRNHWLASLQALPKVNHFDSLKEKLPSFLWKVKPLVWGGAFRFLSEHSLQGEWLKLSYAKGLQDHLPSLQSIRLQTSHHLYRSFSLPGACFTPNLGIVGVYYQNSPQKKPVALSLLKYGATLQVPLLRCFSLGTHTLKPYLEFQGVRLGSAKENHFIFSIQDGYTSFHKWRLGIQSYLWEASYKLSSDLYFYLFLKTYALPVAVPKLYLKNELDLPRLSFYTECAWNWIHQRLDLASIKTKYTYNENMALSLELRYRSPYQWRKANPENFTLDLLRSEKELLHSPLSDQRMSLFTHGFLRLTPFWSCQIRSHHGWLRKKQTPYHEWKLDFFTPLSTHWHLRLTYQHTQRDDRVSAGIELLKK